MGIISLYVVFWNSRSEHVHAWPNDTFHDLLGRLESKPATATVRFNGVAFDRDQKLSAAGIVEGSIILLHPGTPTTVGTKNVTPKRGLDATGKRKRPKKTYTRKKVRAHAAIR
jgi:hypothetical protein